MRFHLFDQYLAFGAIKGMQMGTRLNFSVGKSNLVLAFRTRQPIRICFVSLEDDVLESSDQGRFCSAFEVYLSRSVSVIKERNLN